MKKEYSLNLDMSWQDSATVILAALVICYKFIKSAN